jgi:hypothetical protein
MKAALLPMSALGQKQTLGKERVMSTLPMKADIGQLRCDGRFVPKADIAPRQSIAPLGVMRIDCEMGETKCLGTVGMASPFRAR